MGGGEKPGYPTPRLRFLSLSIAGIVCVSSVVHIPPGSLHGGSSSYGQPQLQGSFKVPAPAGDPGSRDVETPLFRDVATLG